MHDLVKKASLQSAFYDKSWLDSQSIMMLMYAAALSSNCSQLVQMIQVIICAMIEVPQFLVFCLTNFM